MLSTETQVFDDAGCCVRRHGSDVNGQAWSLNTEDSPGAQDAEVITHSDGTNEQIDPVWGAHTWSMSALEPIAFGTFGAHVARTVFDGRGRPVETLFETSKGQLLSRVRYVCNEAGQVSEATQSLVACAGGITEQLLQVEAALALRTESGSATDPSAVGYFKVFFEYNDIGMLLSWSTTLRGKRVHRCAFTYNAVGDVATEKIDDQQPVSFQYEYDGHDNWVRRTARHATGLDEDTRQIVYYGEE